LCILVGACSSPTALPTPRVAVVDPTQFVETRVAQLLTEGAATVAARPTETPAASPTATPTRVGAATPTPTATITPTPTLTPVPTLPLSNFPAPPAAFGGEPHFYFARPIGEGGNVFIASSYRYGSTLNNQLETHHGVEFANPLGAPIVAVAPGTVYYAGADAERTFGPTTNFYGHLVVLQLAQPWNGRTIYALYGHMDQVWVGAGQAVGAGEPLGTVGATGVALGAHLHLEVRLDNPESYWNTRNPELWIAPGAGRGALAVRVTNENNRYLPGRRVTLLCSDGAPRFLDTYWDPGVNPDDLYGENAAMTDVPAGFCQLETTLGEQELIQPVDVQAGTMNFVWLKP
jgi:murein DD-endopeptidase MepM/ murein hydrolase activator NlpD